MQALTLLQKFFSVDMVIYAAIGWSLGILYSIAFTSFFVVFVCSLLGTSED